MTRLVQAENVTKRSIAKVVSLDNDSLATVLIVSLLGASEDDTGTASIPRRLLTSLFGAGPLRDIMTRTRADLRHRITLLLDEEMRRFADRDRCGGRAGRRRQPAPLPGDLRPGGGPVNPAATVRSAPYPGAMPRERGEPVRAAERAGAAGPDRLRPGGARRVQRRPDRRRGGAADEGGGAAAPVVPAHHRGAGRRNGQRQVVAVQPACRGAVLTGGGAPPGDQGAARLRLGHGRGRAAAGLAGNRAAPPLCPLQCPGRRRARTDRPAPGGPARPRLGAQPAGPPR